MSFVHAGPGHPVNRSPLAVLGAAVAALTLAVLPVAAHAQDPMAGMHGHAQITIPEGVLYTVPDVQFMQGMIAHHAQAIYMSNMAEAHHADSRVLRLAEKIAQSQIAEIRIMQDWLSRNGQAVPDSSSWRTMHMAGMLTPAQLDSLDAARGPAFDHAYLTYMIQHHEGALQMVEDLFNTPLAGQDVDVNVFANDVVTVQTAEIGVMQRMLSQMSDK